MVGCVFVSENPRSPTFLAVEKASASAFSTAKNVGLRELYPRHVLCFTIHHHIYSKYAFLIPYSHSIKNWSFHNCYVEKNLLLYQKVSAALSEPISTDFNRQTSEGHINARFDQITSRGLTLCLLSPG